MFTIPWSPVDRSIGFGVTVCGIAIAALNSPSFFGQIPQFDPWWIVLCLTLPGSLLLMAAGRSRLPTRTLRAIWIAQPFALLFILFLGYAAWRSEATDPPFLLVSLLDCIVLCTMALAARLLWVLLLTFLLAIAPLVSIVAFHGVLPSSILAQGFVHSSNVIFVMLILVLRDQMHRLSRARAVAKVLRTDEEQARTDSEDFSQFARMIHDEVLSSFAATVRFSGPPPTALRRSAASALRALRARGLTPESSPRTVLTTDDASQLLLDLVYAAAPGLKITSTVQSGTVSSAAAGALCLAAAEAARNAVRHAMEGVGSALFADGMIRVTITDSGRGFDMDMIPADHFGVRESIIGRISAIDGGHVTIHSNDMGTTVVMQWTRPRA